ncbi:tetratricopeptide repeat protein [Clostridium gasigenes]|uniref:Tetratricopeptide repeat protein n=1 Tax=Clostridium gasigenes TaxID=94869 RepID=A0A7X0SES6_9CLOT|nr:tetratricopeptide repeat protein [Clostridium gasigenes]MBB6716274.1 tetratricopeptide repeat protein [Clostridium gasigenes]
MKKYNILSISIIIVMSFFIVGCAGPKGDPTQTLNQYYEKIKANNIEGAYDLLADETKENFNKEDFVKWQELQKEISDFKEFKVEKTSEYKEKEWDSIKFKNVVEFNVTEKVQNLSVDKEETQNYKRMVVNNNGEWKVYREKTDTKELIANSLTMVSWLYIEGKGGKSKDLNRAAIILNDALKYKSDLPDTHYALARTYAELGRFDEAIEPVNNFLQKTEDKEEQSDGYNILGIIYESKVQKNKAVEYYSKALELNPNNQYAKTNLQRVK